jgi:hypothetical protein
MIKLIAHTVVDAYGLSNTFLIRFMERSGLLPKYVRASIAFLAIVSKRTEGSGPLFRPQDIDALVKLSVESAESQQDLTIRYWHAVVDEWTLEPKLQPELSAKLLEESLVRLGKIEAIFKTPTKPDPGVHERETLPDLPEEEEKTPIPSSEPVRTPEPAESQA